MSDPGRPFSFRATRRPVLRRRSVMWCCSDVDRLGPDCVVCSEYGIGGLPKRYKGTRLVWRTMELAGAVRHRVAIVVLLRLLRCWC